MSVSVEQVPENIREDDSRWFEAKLPTLALIPIAAVVWWLTGFLPWILGGFGHDMFGSTSSIDVPLMAVPLFTGNVGALVLGAGAGGLGAGLVALLGRDSSARSAAAVVAGVFVAMLIVLAQSRLVQGGSGQGTFDTDGRVLTGLTLLVVLTSLVGLAIGLVALSGQVGLGYAIAAAAGATPMLVSALLAVIGFDRQGTFEPVAAVARWSGALGLVLALVIIGVRPLSNVVSWPVAILLAWFISPTVTAATYVEPLLRPGSGVPGNFGDHFSAAAQVWRYAAAPDARPVLSWFIAVAVAAAISISIAVRAESKVDHDDDEVRAEPADW